MKLHGAIDYKSKESVAEQLKKLAPNGVDFFYDNVGGSILDDILNVIRLNGRIIICGAVSQYSGNLNVGSVQGPSNYLKLAENGAEMKGFVVMQYMARIIPAIISLMTRKFFGTVKMTETIESGIESFAPAIQKMFEGEHVGKLIVEV